MGMLDHVAASGAALLPWWLPWLLVAILLPIAFFDIPLMLRFIHICLIRPRVLQRAELRRKHSNPATTAAYFMDHEHVHHAKCSSRDVDLLFHMNNARYAREADFARHEFFVECGLFQAAWQRGTPLVTGAQSIRYRRELPFGARFTVRTRVVGWDEKSLVLQQLFTTKPRRRRQQQQSSAQSAEENDEVVHAVLIVREAVMVPKTWRGAKTKKRALKKDAPSIPDNDGDDADAAVRSKPFRTLAEGLQWGGRVPEVKAPPPDVKLWLDSLLSTSTTTSGSSAAAAAGGGAVSAGR